MARHQLPTDAAAIRPGTDIRQHIQSGYALIRQSRTGDAVRLAHQLADLAGHNVDALVFIAEAHFAAGDEAAALDWLERAIEAGNRHPALLLKKAGLLEFMQRRAEVIALAGTLADTLKQDVTSDPRLQWELGLLYQRNNLHANALALLQDAAARLGPHPALLYDTATSLFYLGDFDRADALLDQVLPHEALAGRALYLRARLRRQTPHRHHVADIEHRLRSQHLAGTERIAALYALAKELEDLGEHERAFQALAEGAAGMRQSLVHYDVARECAAMDDLRAAYDRQAMAAQAVGHPEPGAIFVVGLPRTGTTLVERLLVQSGQVAGVGELPDIANLLGAAARGQLETAPSLTPALASLRCDFAALGRRYMQSARAGAGGALRFVDKQPLNFLYCGAIAKALPEARIVHVVRDPMDACHAMLKTLFFGAYNFSYALDDLADYYLAYDRIMRHWHDVMPGRILDVRYEDVVADPTGQARRLHEWCGLEWHEDALERPLDATLFASASSAQVREPVHTRSLGSAARHARQLQPLQDRLEAAGVLRGAYPADG